MRKCNSVILSRPICGTQIFWESLFKTHFFLKFYLKDAVYNELKFNTHTFTAVVFSTAKWHSETWRKLRALSFSSGRCPLIKDRKIPCFFLFAVSPNVSKRSRSQVGLLPNGRRNAARPRATGCHVVVHLQWTNWFLVASTPAQQCFQIMSVDVVSNNRIAFMKITLSETNSFYDLCVVVFFFFPMIFTCTASRREFLIFCFSFTYGSSKG